MPDRDRFGGSERDYRPATDGFSRVLGSDFGFPTETAGNRQRNTGGQNYFDRRLPPTSPPTTVPEGFNAPDRFGRMRPTGATNPYAAPIDNNPMRGANIGGGWNLYEGAPDRRWEWMKENMVTPMSGDMDKMAYNVGDIYPLGQIDNYGRRLPNSPDPAYNDLKTIPLDMQFDQFGNPIGSDDYGNFDDYFAARGGLMSLRR